MQTAAFASTEYPFELLHTEIVELIFDGVDSSDQTSVADAKAKLEYMGYRVGFALIEKLSKESSRFSSELDIMRFMCKEFWTSVFGKQADNLKTNHQGTYVVNDNCFGLLSSYSQNDEWVRDAPKYVTFSTGVIRGALSNLGVTASVLPEIMTVPAVKFSIQMHSKS